MSKYLSYLLVMAGVTYLIRLLPILIFTKKIKNRFVLSFLYYVPYAILTAMVVPAIITSTGNIICGTAGFICAVTLALCNKDYVKIIIITTLLVLVLQIIFSLF